MSNQDNIKICRWKCRGLTDRLFELEKYAIDWNIFMITENIS